MNSNFGSISMIDNGNRRKFTDIVSKKHFLKDLIYLFMRMVSIACSPKLVETRGRIIWSGSIGISFLHKTKCIRMNSVIDRPIYVDWAFLLHSGWNRLWSTIIVQNSDVFILFLAKTKLHLSVSSCLKSRDDVHFVLWRLIAQVQGTISPFPSST